MSEEQCLQRVALMEELPQTKVSSGAEPNRSRGNMVAWLALIVSILALGSQGYTSYVNFIVVNPRLKVSIRSTLLSSLNPVPGATDIVAFVDDHLVMQNDGNRPVYINAILPSLVKLDDNAASSIYTSKNLALDAQILALPLRSWGSSVPSKANEGVIVVPGEMMQLDRRTMTAFDHVNNPLIKDGKYAWIYSFVFLDKSGHTTFRKIVASVITFTGKDPRMPSLADFSSTNSGSMQTLLN